MKTKLFLLVAIVLGFVSVGMAQKASAADDKTLMDNEKMAWKNLVEKKYDDFGRMFADDYQGVYPDDNTTKASELAMVKQMMFKTADVSNIKVSYPAKNVAIVTAVVKSEMTAPDGKTFNAPLKSTTVYVKRGSQWQIVYHSHFTQQTM